MTIELFWLALIAFILALNSDYENNFAAGVGMLSFSYIVIYIIMRIVTWI